MDDPRKVSLPELSAVSIVAKGAGYQGVQEAWDSLGRDFAKIDIGNFVEEEIETDPIVQGMENIEDDHSLSAVGQQQKLERLYDGVGVRVHPELSSFPDEGCHVRFFCQHHLHPWQGCRFQRDLDKAVPRWNESSSENRALASRRLPGLPKTRRIDTVIQRKPNCVEVGVSALLISRPRDDAPLKCRAGGDILDLLRGQIQGRAHECRVAMPACVNEEARFQNRSSAVRSNLSLQGSSHVADDWVP